MEHRQRMDIGTAPNFRDLGGYAAADRKTVKWGLVYRSDDLSALTDAELDTLQTLGLKTVIDFRSRQEAVYSPDRLPLSVQKIVPIPIDAGKLIGSSFGGNMNRRKTMGIMISIYRQLALEAISSYRIFFEVFADPANCPILFHCTAGKDRTGFGAAMFLASLGVSRQTIIEDYLYSTVCLKDKYIKGRDYDETMEPLYTVYPEFIESALNAIDETYGSVETYLQTQLGVDLKAMREAYTE